jgi:hypothetical protein
MSPFNASLEEARMNGREAYGQGKFPMANPYDKYDARRKEWHEGFIDAAVEKIRAIRKPAPDDEAEFEAHCFHMHQLGVEGY